VTDVVLDGRIDAAIAAFGLARFTPARAAE